MSTKVTRIDSESLRMIGERATKALEDLGRELGITIGYREGKFGGGTGQIFMDLSVNAEDGTPISRGEHDFRKHARGLGLRPEDFGRKFEHDGEEFEISGVVAGRTRTPILARRLSDSRLHKFTLTTIRTACPPPPPPPPVAPPAPAPREPDYDDEDEIDEAALLPEEKVVLKPVDETADPSASSSFGRSLF